MGPQHPEVALTLNDLAVLYYNLGDCAKAEALYKRSLAIMEKALGSEHPKVAIVLRNMAACFKKTGKEKDSKKLEERANIIETRKLLR